MQRKLQKLLCIQLLLMMSLLVVGWLIDQRNWLPGLSAGSLIAIFTTIMAMIIFRRLPKVAPARMFYGAMILNEVMKWLLVAVLTVLLVQHVVPFALITGFMVTYLAYFWLILVD